MPWDYARILDNPGATETQRMSQNDSENGKKNRKFFGFEVSETVTYIVVIVLALIFIRQVAMLF